MHSSDLSAKTEAREDRVVAMVGLPCTVCHVHLSSCYDMTDDTDRSAPFATAHQSLCHSFAALVSGHRLPLPIHSLSLLPPLPRAAGGDEDEQRRVACNRGWQEQGVPWVADQVELPVDIHVQCDALAIFLPSTASANSPVPALYRLSGLTCSGARRTSLCTRRRRSERQSSTASPSSHPTPALVRHAAHYTTASLPPPHSSPPVGQSTAADVRCRCVAAECRRSRIARREGQLGLQGGRELLRQPLPPLIAACPL